MPRFIELSRIRVAPKRQRRFRSEEDHQELLTSINEGEAGLIHAPLLWQDGEDFWLVAGEGRLKVIGEMYELGMGLRYEGAPVPPGTVPYTLIGESSPLGRFEAEFDENVRRTALTVAERASSTAELFELKRMKAERDGTRAPTVGDLATELRGSPIGSYQETTRRELIVARHLDDQDVAKAKTLDEAYNAVKRKETQRRATAIAKEMGTNVRAHGIELVHADALAWLPTCESARFDIVLSDPPYGVDADQFGEYNDSTEHLYDDSFESWQVLMRGVLPELGRVCKPDAHLYLFCDFDRFHTLKALLEIDEWKVHRTPIIWKNPAGFRTPWPEHGPQRKYELVLYARRGGKKTLKVYPDVVEYSRDRDSVHVAQKPVALLRDLLTRSALPNDAVLDFCAGSCSTGIACHEMGLACVCVEKAEIAYGNGVKRLQTVTKG